ncbi:MAG: transporter substrate-binding domain-containing protein [Phycisphaerae bacterium]
MDVRANTGLVLLMLVTLLVPRAPLCAQDASGDRLIVGTRHVPPFAIKGPSGEWSGISIDLWRDIATDLRIEYVFEETNLQGLIDGLQDGRLDAAVAALTVTASREKVVDFTHVFYHSGLGIAVPAKHEPGWAAVLKRVASTQFAGAVAILALVLFIVGFVVWLFERNLNPEQFGGRIGNGLGSAFWWSAVTMTTVGYGDKAPRSFGGRFVALIWMFASILLISSFTAGIASALTVSQLDTGIDGPEDLPGLRVATVPGSTSEAYLARHHVVAVPYETPADALQAVDRGEADVAVYDAPILRYLVNKELRLALRVVPRVFEPQDYAIALRQGSTLREPVNQALLEKTTAADWQDLLYSHLGE